MPTHQSLSTGQLAKSLARSKPKADQIVAHAPVVYRARSITRCRERIHELTQVADQLRDCIGISAEARTQWLEVLKELRAWETLLVEVAGYAKRPAPVVKNGRVQFGHFAAALDVTAETVVNDPQGVGDAPELLPDAPESAVDRAAQ